MGSYFDDLMANAAPNMMRAFGRASASYVASSGVETAGITIYVGAISTEDGESEDGSNYTIRKRTFTVLKDEQQVDFPGLDLVQMRGKFVIDAVTWQVEDVRFENDYEIHGVLTNSRERRKIAPRSFRR